MGDGAGDFGEGAGEFVEAVSDGDVFHYVGLVKDVGAGGGDVDVYEVGGGGGGGGGVGHSFEEGADVGGREGEAAAGVDVADGGLGFARGEVGYLSCLVVVGGVDLDGFDGEWVVGVLGEHGDEDVVDDLGFGFVGCRDVDEDVSCFGTDFRVVAVYYWRHGADCPVGVEYDRIDWGVSNYVKVARKVLVVLLPM